jgi:hypothetical protein
MSQEREEWEPAHAMTSFVGDGREWHVQVPSGEGPARTRMNIAPPTPRNPRLHPAGHDVPAIEQLNETTELRRIRRASHAQSPGRLESEATRAATISRTGLQLSSKMTFDKWLRIGLDLAMAANSAAWWMGDWLIYGETAYSGRYRSAIEQTSLDYKTLRNYAWVARRFTPERRHEGLSFGHHAEVAALAEPEQDFWLRKAETLGWSRNELRQGVRASLREREEIGGSAGDDHSPAEHHDGDGDTIPSPVLAIEEAGEHLKIRLTPQQLDVIREAASSARVAVEVWVAHILEQAAARVLNSVGRKNAA